MKAKAMFTSIGVILMVAALLFSGCSSQEEESTEGLLQAVADSIATDLVEEFIESTQVEAIFASEITVEDTAVEAEIPPEVQAEGINDMVLVGSKIYACHDAGVIIYDMADKNTVNLVTGKPINAIVLHGGKVYVGGEDLLLVNGVDFEPVEFEFAGVVNELHSYHFNLMIGTTEGLYSRSILGDETLLEGMAVSSMAADESGLWVGTTGNGLYHYDGEDFSKRFLSRDPSLFDYVNCLAFNHSHLYVGTDSGMFIFDGGRWITLTSADGLPSDKIRAFDATTWVTYVGTSAGVTSYFNGDFMPVKKLADKKANSIRLLGRKIIIGTASEGVLMKSGPALKTLIDPNNPTPQNGVDIFSLSL